MKKNAIFKRAREHNGQISREILASVYVAHVPDGWYYSLMLFRHDARAMLEEIRARNKQDRSMGDLISMLARRDVRDPLDLACPFSLCERKNAVECLIEEFGVMPAEVSPMRSTVINSASSTRESLYNQQGVNACANHSIFLLVQEQQDFYEESRRKIVRGAKTYVEAGIERQQVKLSIFLLCVPSH